MKTLKVESKLSEINKIRQFLKDVLKGLHLSEEDYYMVELSLIEVCINVMRYAYPSRKKGYILLNAWEQKGRFYIEIRDNGIPFDPRKTKKPDINSLIKSKKKGGLGIFITRKMMDGFKYKRDEGENVLLLYKKLNHLNHQ
ncbi:MAG: ATP-binding protein [Candidatus Aminicenantes bacterium]|nr:ATP-binding protein [Candidatus Aminicenantes bacterium]